ncbi:MAG: FGGY-family carbohydrate kinase [Armatimonadota bacterium]
MYVLGVDVGTQGARAVVCDAEGSVVGSAHCLLAQSSRDLPDGWFEQDPEDWWRAACRCLNEVVAQLRANGASPAQIKAIAADSTSGTVLPIDHSGKPLRPAIMYNDARASLEAQQCNEAAGAALFNASFALAKILWIRSNEPEVYRSAVRFIHAADYLVGKLTGRWDVTDFSNALKTGYDLSSLAWPEMIEAKLGVPLSKLPKVAVPGEPIAAVSAEAAEATGLSVGTAVVAGMTDGTAGFVASGAAAPGQWNTTLGTTLVVRGVSHKPVHDAQGRIYNHRHPQGYWLPGGASNTGGEWFAIHFPGRDYAELDRQAEPLLPTEAVVYPLARKGERLPFLCREAEGFMLGEAHGEAELYAAGLQGVALVERWTYELLESLGAGYPEEVFTTGGGAKSRIWSQVRADVLQVPVAVPQNSEAVVGSAILAASRTLYSDLSSAAKAMVRVGYRVEPRPALAEVYRAKLETLKQGCVSRGYIG